MAKTHPFNVTTPIADSVAHPPSQGAARIIELKNAIHERENEDHYWEKVGNIVDGDNVGYHRKSTYLEQAADPAAKADAIILYGKLVGSICELFARDESNTPYQITEDGALKMIAGLLAFRSGDLLISSSVVTPTDWTDVTATYDGRFMRVSSGTALDTGGADTHTHGVGSYKGPSHTHLVSGTTGGQSANQIVECGSCVVVSKAHTHAVSITSGAGGAGAITGTSAAGDNVPKYINVKTYQKDA